MRISVEVTPRMSAAGAEVGAINTAMAQRAASPVTRRIDSSLSHSEKRT
jgi:hypothetical protein